MEKYDVIWRLESGMESVRGMWEVGQVRISGKSIIISAEKDEASNTGYVALDDFLGFSNAEECKTTPAEAVVTKTTTQPPTTTTTTTKQPTTTTPSPFPDCTFETGYCGWTSGDNIDNQTDIFVFIRSKGVLHEVSHDGPEADHEINKNGKIHLKFGKPCKYNF